jgi:hypothetical protein
MRKLITLFVILFIILGIFACGCVDNSNNDDYIKITDAEAQEKIIGLWSRNNWDQVQTWEFRANNTIKIFGSNLAFEYWFENNTLFTYIQKIDYMDRYIYKFYDNFNNLTLGLISNDVIVDPETSERIDPDTIEFEISLTRFL